ncbi:MAG: hypothetical protein U5M23_09625 [Marinagarivorans sp.]|nr:hypothetical protein [Marinagarivorans sp.]
MALSAEDEAPAELRLDELTACELLLELTTMLDIELGAAELATDDTVATAEELLAGVFAPSQAASQSAEKSSNERVITGVICIMASIFSLEGINIGQSGFCVWLCANGFKGLFLGLVGNI